MLRAIWLLATVVFSLSGAAFAQARDCDVARLEGQEVRIWNAGTWTGAGTGPLPPGATKIMTGRETRVEIRCDDGVVVTVGESTEINVEVLSAPPPSTSGAVLQLIRGIVGVLAPEVSSGFEVRTPLAIASVRSTEWLVEHAAEDGSAVFVREGQVSVATPTRRVVLGAGEGITVPPSGETQDVKTWGADRIGRSANALGFSWQ